MDTTFSTRVKVESAFYDPEKRMLCMVLFLKLTGDKRIVYCPKEDWHFHDGAPGDFPDSEMYKFAELIKGKDITWTMQDDPNIKTSISKKDKEELTDSLVKQIDNINKEIQDDNPANRIIANNAKEKFQNELRDRLRKEIGGK